MLNNKWNEQGMKITGVDVTSSSSGILVLNVRGMIPNLRMSVISGNMSLV